MLHTHHKLLVIFATIAIIMLSISSVSAIPVVLTNDKPQLSDNDNITTTDFKLLSEPTKDSNENQKNEMDTVNGTLITITLIDNQTTISGDINNASFNRVTVHGNLQSNPATNSNGQLQTHPDLNEEYEIWPGLKGFAFWHATKQNGRYYFKRNFDKTRMREYLDGVIVYMAQHKNTLLYINLDGHGFFDNREVFADNLQDDKPMTIYYELMENLEQEMKYRSLDWIGIYDYKEKKWSNVFWGYHHLKPSYCFKCFGWRGHNIVEKDGSYYLNEPLNISTVFDYIEDVNDCMVTMPVMETFHPSFRGIVINIKGHGVFNNNELIVGVYPTRKYSKVTRNCTSPSYLREAPKSKTGIYYINAGGDGEYGVWVDMDKINALTNEINSGDLKWMGVYDEYYIPIISPVLKLPPIHRWRDVVWGRTEIPA